MTELLRREGRIDEEPPLGRLPRMYRVVAVLAGFVLLCGAVTASTAALSGPRVARAVPSTVAVTTITGAEALRPGLIRRAGPVGAPSPGNDGGSERIGDGPDPSSAERTPRTLPPADPAPAGAAVPPPQPPTVPTPPPAAPDPSDAQPDDGGKVRSDPVADVVTRFYQTVIEQPREAFALLSPQLQGTGYAEFHQAWAGAQRAAVEDIHRDGPQAALVTVRLEQRDGSVLRTLQRVVVVPGVKPRITDVALLSASRS